ncbi:MAG: DEAD/DEAH box helicase [Bacteroidales bacterium]|jgi:non-specific serine/threonine protein kinase|nr:DEAD/DEAH box helicase [Bacteroidales bacterium]
MELSEVQCKAIGHIEYSFEHNINPICSLDMGSGKTRVACKIIASFHQKNRRYCVLIITKSSLFRKTWIKELEECKIENISSCIICLHGKEREKYLGKDAKYSFSDNKIILTSYDTLVKDIENNRYNMEYIIDLMVIDEIQLFMNSNRLTKRCKIISKLPAVKKLALSGTPIQNTSLELGLTYLFLNEPMEIPIRGKISENTLKSAKDRCLENNAIFYLFGDKKGDYKKHETILCLPVNPVALSFTREKLSGSQKRLMYLSHPDSVYYKYGKQPETVFCTKVEAVKAIVNKNRLNKTVVFSRFINVLYAYEDMFVNEGTRVIMVTGKDKGRELNEKLELFEFSDCFNVLLTTLQKSSEGLNFSFANHIIILEFWWNPQKIFQAMNRINRKDQKSNIFIYLLCYHDQKCFIKEEYGMYKKMRDKNEDANEVLASDNVNKGINIRSLPEFITISDMQTFETELTECLLELYKNNHTYKDYYIEETHEESFYKTVENIKNHPLMKKYMHEFYQGAMEEAIKESNANWAKQNRTKNPYNGV